ncbi:MAG: FtsX-like permease family protein [Desulfofustis sp. PB-SRB1]|jgi:putative ABC transport system permease protein|nr:FtsX-like permease family protein [Desulfofustis sp. PB-SRB1]MBM1001342.1 FtsX-like permease family protein [Desulfofustis sp. PB-SRB1]HBH29679.1 ABC transporter permease [Desulfofustis sp.]HBH31977.1 ABC transporter permease [Desulfofustis sp.]
MKRLIALPLKKSAAIAFQSIRVRFFRSLVTTMSLVLAVAFLCYIQVSNDFAQSLLASGNIEARQILVKAGYDIEFGEQTIATSAKQRWIVILSLLVCIVGIINAQLMSVTERFREIGTMKCLGALDRFIVRLFILEALMQGLAGSVAGAVLGALAAAIASVSTFGLAALATTPWLSIVSSMLGAVAVGTSLSLLGVIYPALLAARMQPVEAMRVEQ